MRVHELPSHGKFTLPSTRRIAQECGVNRGTVLRVIHTLAEQGLIKTVRKPSTVIVQDSAPEDPSVSVRQTLGPRSMGVCRSLLRDIIDCRLRPGSMLPSFKELRAIYGCSAVTIHAVVNSLISTGYVQRFRHGYRIHQHSSVGGRLFLTLIIPEKKPKTGRIPNRIAGFWIDIARECGRLNVNLETYGYYCSSSDRERRERLRQFTHDINDRVLGYFIMLVDGRPADILDVMAILRATGKPMAVWDVGEQSIMPLPPPFCNDPRILIIARSLIESGGRIIGRRLIDLGHRNVAVIMSHHWGNDLILQGLQKSFAEAGLETGLTFFPVTEDAVALDWHAPHVTNAYRALQSGIAMAARAVDPQWKGYARFEEQIRAGMWNHLYNNETRRLFKRALADRAVTCIVGIHWDARLVLDVCRENKLKIPEHLSLVGVVNSEEHIATGITCCDWNFPAVVNAMVDHFLKPAPIQRNRNRMVDIQSILLERQSSGPVYKR
ncbi:MAG: GntR family transcriptional regulator [Chitinispirillaceae bacterium]|nr:GntR family transcriptional regulator [Chitinispirillaceae bacterium]